MKIETSKRITLVILVILVSFFILAPVFVSAAGLVPCGRAENDPDTPNWDETKKCDLCDMLWLVKNIMDLVLKLGGIICFLLVVAGAILFLVAGGSANLLATGKKIFVSAVIGLAIILLSWLIVSAVMGATGYNAADDWYKFECEGPTPPPPPTHLACQNGECKRVEGAGDDTCQSDNECGHLECQNGECKRVEGAGDDKCSSDIDCQPVWTCESAGQVYAECETKSDCESLCENVLFTNCGFDDSCQDGGVVYECLQTDNCSEFGLSYYSDSYCGGSCPDGSRCCGGTEEKMEEAKCKLDCYPYPGEYNPETGECACITESHLECKTQPGLTTTPGGLPLFTCQRIAGPDPNPDQNPCATKSEGDECTPIEGISCPSGKDRQCPLSQICENKVCVNGCRKDPDCPAGQICENGSCISGCRKDEICYQDHPRCPDGNCTEYKCCSGYYCEEKTWLRPKTYCRKESNGEIDPFEGYTLQVDEKQKDHASQDLMDLLACMKPKLDDVPEAREISSISDDGILSDPVKCNYLQCSGNVCGGCKDENDVKLCAHVCNSCHYGGRNCNTQERFSYAVDFAREDYCDEIKTAALECNADAFVNYEESPAHVHVSLNKTSGCNCNEKAVGNPCP